MDIKMYVIAIITVRFKLETSTMRPLPVCTNKIQYKFRMKYALGEEGLYNTEYYLLCNTIFVVPSLSPPTDFHFVHIFL